MKRHVCLAPLGLALIALSISLAACGGGGGSKPSAATETTSPSTAVSSATPAQTASDATTTPTPGSPNEGGSAPVYYRTSDNFASIVADQPYKVLFRVTNGYAEQSLTVVADCTDCPAGPDEQTFVGQMATPGAGEAAGSYYPTNITLPYAGHWEIAVLATPDRVVIPIEVLDAP
jgi:hypothetical protein